MKILSVMTLAAVTAADSYAGQVARDAERKLVVCIAAVNDFAVLRAKSLAAGMLAAAGVKIEWRPDRSCPPAAIRIGFSDRTDVNLLPGAFAYSLPYEGTRIQVFYDRVELLDRKLVPSVLAHVLVHEITHILQGVSRHSESGVMKADWKTEDYTEMFFHPLPFTKADVELIHNGLDAREARRAAANFTPARLVVP